MRKIWNGKKKCISVLVLAATVFAMAFTSAYGASGIDTNAQGTITFGVGTPGLTELTAEGTKIQVSLYKVANVLVSGKYDVVEPFNTEPLEKEIESVSDKTKPDEWNAYAAEAAAIVRESSDDTSGGASGTPSIKSNYDVTIIGGKTEQTTVGVGLYLALVDTVKTETYQYTADPFLIAVPGNDYYPTQGASDEWIYEVESNIKFKSEDLLGDLSIDKELKTYNDSLGTATFVYEVKAVKDYRAVGGKEETVYNNVVTIDFSGAGSKSTVISDLPAGAEVTVTEVYSGASYSVDGAASGEKVIAADDTVHVDFTNDYNGKLLYQDTVVNNFSHNGKTWDWTPITSHVSE